MTDDSDVVTAVRLSALADSKQAQGDYAAARPLLEEALAIRRRVLGADHPSTANSLSALGSLDYVQGKYQDGRLHHEEALAIQRRLLGPDHPDTVASLSNLGVSHYALAARGKTPRFRPREASAWPAARRLNLAPSPGIS